MTDRDDPADAAASPTGSASAAVPGLDDLLALVGLPNPLSGIVRTVDQFRRGTDELLTTMARFNETLEQLNGVARRVNGLLDEIEEPVKVAVPQLTRTVKAADVITQQLVAPIERLTPGLGRLAEALAHPSITRLPTELVSVTESLGELVRRLAPLAQVAESAGSMFGLRGLGALGGLVNRASDSPVVTAPSATSASTAGTTTKAASKTAPSKKAATKKATTKKAATKKAATKKAGTKKAPTI